MDDMNKTGEEQNPLSALLSNPEVMAALSGLAANLKNQMAEPSKEPTEQAAPASAPQVQPSNELLSPEVMAKLPEVMAALSPMLGGNSGEKKTHDKKTALLNALRPYLSEGRCEAIDYIARLEKLSDVVKNIRL